MIGEVIGIGDEILLGVIANTNARWISERLAAVGVDVRWHQAVGDDVERIAEAFRLAAGRAEVVVATGGLGPTGDDLTREGVVAAFGLSLERRPEIETWLHERFARMRREMPASNLRQADVPEGARWITPERGTAPGLILEQRGTWIYAVPGVPAEMEEMMEGVVLPALAALAGGTIVTLTLRVSGMAEAALGEALHDLYASLENPRMAFLASEGEVRVRLTASAPSEEEADALIAPPAAEVRARLGRAIYGEGEERLEGVIGERLRERGLWLSCAESLTGGALASRIVSVRDASKHFSGGVVAYSADAKVELLGVPQELIDEHGTVSEACALAMARGARERFGSDVALATTGVAGPDALEDKPPGTVWVALAAEGVERARTFVAPGDRDQVRRWAVQSALDLLRRWLED